MSRRDREADDAGEHHQRHHPWLQDLHIIADRRTGGGATAVDGISLT